MLRTIFLPLFRIVSLFAKRTKEESVLLCLDFPAGSGQKVSPWEISRDREAKERETAVEEKAGKSLSMGDNRKEDLEQKGSRYRVLLWNCY